MLNRFVWGLLAMAAVFWGACVAFAASRVHLGWFGTLFASAAGLLATISSYRSEDKVHCRGGGYIYKSASPFAFFIAYAFTGLFLIILACCSIPGCMGLVVN